jgi:RNA polymerase primary sigma factor
MIMEYQETKDDKIREKLIAGFGRYVVSIAQNYQNNGLDLSDLISEGFIGFMAAVDGFDSSRDVKFVTYAHKVIGNFIREAIEHNGNMLKLPKNIRNDMRKAKKFFRTQEINNVDVRMLPEDKIPEFARPYVEYGAEYKKVSLDAFIPSAAAAICDNNQLSNGNPGDESDAAITNADLKIELIEAMDRYLTPHQKQVVCIYFGINQEYPLNSYVEVGNKLNLSATEIKNTIIESFSLLKPHIGSLLDDFVQ